MLFNRPFEPTAQNKVRLVLARWRSEWMLLTRRLWNLVCRDRKASIYVIFEEARLSVFARRSDSTQDLGAIARPPDADRAGLAARLAQMAASAGAATDLDLRFPKSAVLYAMAKLPKTSRRTLVQALGYELARLSPLEADALYFDFAVRPGERTSPSRDIALRIARRDYVDDAIALCRDAGYPVATIGFVDDPRLADYRQFPVDRAALLRSLWRRYGVLFLAGFAVLLTLLLIAAACLRQSEEAAALASQLADARAKAARVERLETRADAALAAGRFLAARKKAPLFVAVLADLSTALPDDTWIDQLGLEGDKLSLDGYSRSASDLTAAFERAGMFSNVRFTAPVTQDARTHLERFDLQVEIRAVRP